MQRYGGWIERLWVMSRPKHSSRKQHYCSLMARLWARSGPITYFTDLALLWLDGMFMREVVASNISHGATMTAIGRQGYGRGGDP